jgi:hypothetical protein
MATVTKSRFEKLCDDVRREANISVGSLGRATLPVSLNDLARREQISTIRFKPILGTAGLLRTGGGFDIVINTEAPGADQPADFVLRVDSDWNVLTPPLRFTVAHEIAQALFVRTSGGDPNKDFFLKNEQAIDHLCNDLASRFLMPEKQLIAAIGPALFDAEHLFNLTRKIGVSPEALARRLDASEFRRAFGEVEGLVSFVRKDLSDRIRSSDQIRFVAGEIWGIRALSQFGIGPVVRPRDGTRKFPSGRSVGDLKLDLSLEDRLQNEIVGVQLRTVAWRGSKPNNLLKCEARFCRTSRKPLCGLLTVQVIEGPTQVEN